MCGRVNIEGPALGEALAVAWPEASGWPLADVYGDAQINVAPQAWVPVLRQDGTLARQRWWFPAPPSAGAGLTTFNARCERALASPLYGPWLPTHRCVFPVTSFMEWWRLPDGRRLPYLLRSPTPAPLYLAGVGRPALSSSAPGADGGEAGGFAVLTCPARHRLTLATPLCGAFEFFAASTAASISSSCVSSPPSPPVRTTTWDPGQPIA